MKTSIALALCLVSSLAGAAPTLPDAPDPALTAVVARMQKLYPATSFKEFRTTPVPGVYEVVMGRNVAYVDETGRYFLFGHMWDMQAQKDLSEALAQESSRIDFDKLPLQDAIKTVKGNGRRKVAVFSDPDCPFCKQIEKTFAQLNDVTIYTFLFPIDGLHPAARAKATAVWCAKDRVKAWNSLMLDGQVPQAACPQTPIESNQKLAQSLGINGTPSLVFASGQMVPGALKAEQLEAMLDSAGGGAK